MFIAIFEFSICLIKAKRNRYMQHVRIVRILVCLQMRWLLNGRLILFRTHRTLVHTADFQSKRNFSAQQQQQQHFMQ